MKTKSKFFLIALSSALVAVGSFGEDRTRQSSEEGQETSAANRCNVIQGEDPLPHKTPNGKYDQGSSSECVFVATVNANLEAFKFDDTNGKYYNALSDCVERDLKEAMRANGDKVPPGLTLKAMLGDPKYEPILYACKGIVNRANGVDAMIVQYVHYEAWICDRIIKTLKAGGAATIGMSSRRVGSSAGHQVTVVSAERDGKKCVFKIIDPTDPGTTHDLTVLDDGGTITHHTGDSTYDLGQAEGGVIEIPPSPGF